MIRRNRWDRRKELLAVLPPPRTLSLSPASRAVSALLSGLAAEWRVFLAHAPVKSFGVPIGGKGMDPLPGDTLPGIRQALSEQLVSGVLLVGTRTVLDHIEMLHSFCPHIPFLAVLDEPAPLPTGKLEFLLGWADRVLLVDESLKARFEPSLRRSGVPVDVLPLVDGRAVRHPSRRRGRAFLSRLSKQIQDCFLSINAKPEGLAAELDWLAFLDESARRRWEPAVGEWRALLPKKGGALLVPRTVPGARRRLERHWPGVRVLPYRDEEHAVAQANRLLAGSRKERMLLIKPSARLGQICVERMAHCARRHPLAAIVGAQSAQRQDGESLRVWRGYSTAWQLHHRGGYRLVREVSADCMLVVRRAAAQSGLLDPRLGWDYAAKDLAIRARQNGWHLFLAEDALVSRMGAGSENERFKSRFLGKWTLDPVSVLADGAGKTR